MYTVLVELQYKVDSILDSIEYIVSIEYTVIVCYIFLILHNRFNSTQPYKSQHSGY